MLAVLADVVSVYAAWTTYNFNLESLEMARQDNEKAGPMPGSSSWDTLGQWATDRRVA